MWREMIKGLTPECTFFEPTTPLQIEALEADISLQLPDRFKSLLLESNGVWGEYGLRLIWSIKEIKKRNFEMREDRGLREAYMPFNSLLFIADAGNGDLFAYTIIQGKIRRSDIFAWNHENDSRTWVAPSLEKYLEWWLQGKIKL